MEDVEIEEEDNSGGSGSEGKSASHDNDDGGDNMDVDPPYDIMDVSMEDVGIKEGDSSGGSGSSDGGSASDDNDDGGDDMDVDPPYDIMDVSMEDVGIEEGESSGGSGSNGVRDSQDSDDGGSRSDEGNREGVEFPDKNSGRGIDVYLERSYIGHFTLEAVGSHRDLLEAIRLFGNVGSEGGGYLKREEYHNFEEFRGDLRQVHVVVVGEGEMNYF